MVATLAMAGRARPFPLGWEGELYLLYVLPSHQRLALAVAGLGLLGAGTVMQNPLGVGGLAGLQTTGAVAFATGLFLLVRAARR